MDHSTTVDDAPAPTPSWPKVIGTIGVVLGVIMLVDKTDDLILIPLLWAGDGWRSLLGPELGDLVASTMPLWAWLFFYILLGMALGVLLVVASLRLRNRYPSGVTLCRTWAWLAIAWVVAGLSLAIWWIATFRDQVARLAEPGWETAAVSGILAALALLLAYPVFLLVWLSRAAVKAEYLTWQE